MLPIYICEDEDSIRQHISSHISTYYEMHPEYEKPKISAFSEPHGLLTSLPETPDMGIYFLDIHLNSDMDGLELARVIRSRDPRGFIVFVTSHTEYASRTFKLQVEALGYIIKDSPHLNASLSVTLTKIHERHAVFQKSSLDNPRLQFRSNRHIHYYFASELIAIMTTEYSHRIKILTVDGSLDLSGSLNQIKRSLPSSHFIQCHRSCIINKNHVRSYDAESHMVELSNHMEVPVSREKRRFFL